MFKTWKRDKKPQRKYKGMKPIEGRPGHIHTCHFCGKKVPSDNVEVKVTKVSGNSITAEISCPKCYKKG